MSKETTLKGKLGDLERLLSSLTANSAELAHLEATRLRFAELLAKAQEAADLQGVHRAAKQEAPRPAETLPRGPAISRRIPGPSGNVPGPSRAVSGSPPR
jgi:anti-sigma factor RsiW